VAVAALLMGCADRSSPIGPSGSGVELRGRVSSYRTGAPVAGVTVRLEGYPSRTVLQAVTAQDGAYTVTVLHVDDFEVSVNGAIAGSLRVHGPQVPGDLFVDGGTCAARYGVVYDNRTLRPVVGAEISAPGANAARSDGRGWYRLTGECPDVFQFGGTTFMRVSHPEFETAARVVGRGFQGVFRQDVVLLRR